MKEQLKEQLYFCIVIVDNLKTSVSDFMKDQQHGYYSSTAYGNRNFGKTAIKRKITLLRNELLNLERMIDNA